MRWCFELIETRAPPISSRSICAIVKTTTLPIAVGVNRSARIWTTPGLRQPVAARIFGKSRSLFDTT